VRPPPAVLLDRAIGQVPSIWSRSRRTGLDTAADRAEPVDPRIELRTDDGRTAALRLSEVAPVRPLVPTRLWKLSGLGERYLPGEALAYPAERFLQTYEIDLAAFTAAVPGFDPTQIASVAVCFAGEGAVFLDDVGFEPAAGS